MCVYNRIIYIYINIHLFFKYGAICRLVNDIILKIFNLCTILYTRLRLLQVRLSCYYFIDRITSTERGINYLPAFYFFFSNSIIRILFFLRTIIFFWLFLWAWSQCCVQNVKNFKFLPSDILQIELLYRIRIQKHRQNYSLTNRALIQANGLGINVYNFQEHMILLKCNLRKKLDTKTKKIRNSLLKRILVYLFNSITIGQNH